MFCVHSEPNYSLPWQRKRQFSSTGSGFLLPDRRILTNAHCVDHHSQVQLDQSSKCKIDISESHVLPAARPPPPYLALPDHHLQVPFFLARGSGALCLRPTHHSTHARCLSPAAQNLIMLSLLQVAVLQW